MKWLTHRIENNDLRILRDLWYHCSGCVQLVLNRLVRLRKAALFRLAISSLYRIWVNKMSVGIGALLVCSHGL